MSACGATGLGPWLREEGGLLELGPAARMTPAAIDQETRTKLPLLYSFAMRAGVPIEPAADFTGQALALARLRAADWPLIARAGEDYIDSQCHEYVTALYNLDRSRRTALANLNTIESATVGIMGLTHAAQSAIGIVGISLGLAGHLFDTTVSSVLFQLPPIAVERVIDAQRTVYRHPETDAGFWANVNNEGAAIQRLSEYIRYCTPVTIEAKIAVILSNTSPDADVKTLVSATPPTTPPAPMPPPLPLQPPPEGVPPSPAAPAQPPPVAGPPSGPAATPPGLTQPPGPAAGTMIGDTQLSQADTRALANLAIDLTALFRPPPRHVPIALRQVAALFVVTHNQNLSAGTAARLHEILQAGAVLELPNQQLNLRPNKTRDAVIGMLDRPSFHDALTRASTAILK